MNNPLACGGCGMGLEYYPPHHLDSCPPAEQKKAHARLFAIAKTALVALTNATHGRASFGLLQVAEATGDADLIFFAGERMKVELLEQRENNLARGTSERGSWSSDSRMAKRWTRHLKAQAEDREKGGWK